MYSIDEFRSTDHLYEIPLAVEREFGRGSIVRAISQRRRAAISAFRRAVVEKIENLGRRYRRLGTEAPGTDRTQKGRIARPFSSYLSSR